MKLRTFCRDPVLVNGKARAHSAQCGDRGNEAFLPALGDAYSAIGHEAGYEVGEGFDSITADLLACPAQVIGAFDDETAIGLELDARPHPLEKERQLDDFGFDRGVLDHRSSLGDGSDEEHSLGGSHAWIGECDARSAKRPGLGPHAGLAYLNLCTKLLQGVEVIVDWAHADRVTADEWYEYFPETMEQRTE